MGMRTLTERPRGRLAHHLGSSYSFWTSTTTHSYMTWPIPLERPETGIATGPVMCGTCMRPVTFRLYDAERTTQLRRLWLVLCAASLVVCAIGIGFLVHVADVPADDIPAIGFVALLTAIIGGGLSAILWFSVWWAEEGLRGPGVFFLGGRGHSIRRV